MGFSGKIRVVLGLAAAGALAYFLLRPTPRTPSVEPAESARPAAAPSSPTAVAPAVPPSAAQPPVAPPSTTPAASAPAPAPAGSPIVPRPAPAASEPPVDLATDLGEVQSTFRDFRTMLGENPVGTNAEITKALLGANLKQVKLPVPSGSQLNGNGELCDHWGTPYFFHQLSKDRMEIRSAGPDRQMWTADDVQR